MNATVLLTSVDINIPGYRILRPIGEGGMDGNGQDCSLFFAIHLGLSSGVFTLSIGRTAVVGVTPHLLAAA